MTGSGGPPQGRFQEVSGTARGVSEWKRVEETLRSRERQLAEAQQLAHLGSWEWDAANDRLEWSDELYRIFGAAPGGLDPTFELMIDLVHPDDRRQVREAIRSSRDRGWPFATDFRILPPDGQLRWVHCRGQPLTDGNGAATRMRGTVQDVTRRKQDDAARAKEFVVRRLLQMVAVAANEAATVADAMQVALGQVCAYTRWPVGHGYLVAASGDLVPTGTWHLDQPERFEAFSRATEASPLGAGLGLPGRVAVSGRPAWITDVTTDDNFPRSEAAREVGIRSGFAVPILVGHAVVGVLEFFSTRAEPLNEEVLDIMAPVGTQLGRVVERTRAADELRASEEHNRAIVDTASDAFVAMDERGVLIAWNRSAEAMFGWTRDEALGRELADTIIPKDLRDAHRHGLADYLATGSGPVVGNRIEVFALHRGGYRFPVELAVWEVRSATSRSFNAFIRDISQQKQAEEALAEARDQALRASRLKSEFLANMSHEIRTPMNGVIGLAGLLLATDLDPIQRKYADGIRSAGDGLMAVINDVLDFSKVEAGRMELEVVDFDLRELIEEATAVLAQSARAKRLELVSDCHSRVPTAVRGDPFRLRQVLVNLVGNAVKFTDRGEVVVRVRVVEEDEALLLVRFEVVDTGVGIHPTHRARLFESFTQADASTTRRHGGTGLGLALAKRLAELMGGEIGVESEPERGSTFWFTTRLARQPGATPSAAGRSLDGARVLVVDDNATNRDILEEQLAGWGMRADAVGDPRQALPLLRAAGDGTDPYELVLVDLQMPEMDGLQLADAIHRDPALADVAVILLSSADGVTDAECRRLGIRQWLLKPVRQSELYDAVVRVMAPGPDPADAAVGRDPPAQVGRPTANVLVVEDNPINQTVAAATVAHLGYEVEVATNGVEAVEAMSRQAYAAVLMDCQMPEMDGYQATAEIRRRERGKRRTPIIAMTASVMEGDRDRCLAAGMDDYLAKPVRGDELGEALGRWVTDAALPAPPGRSPSKPGLSTGPGGRLG